MPKPLTRKQRGSLTDLVEQFRNHGYGAGIAAQTVIFNQHPFLRDQDNVRIFFNRLNDSWRLHPATIQHALNRSRYITANLDRAFFNARGRITDESRFWYQLLATEQHYQADPWASQQKRENLQALRNHLANQGNRMLRDGQLWPNQVNYNLLRFTARKTETGSAYPLYDSEFLRECRNTPQTPSRFVSKQELDNVRQTLQRLDAARADLLQNVWLPEFLTRREQRAIPTDITPTYLIALYPELAKTGARRYYHRMSTRRRRTLDLGDG